VAIPYFFSQGFTDLRDFDVELDLLWWLSPRSFSSPKHLLLVLLLFPSHIRRFKLSRFRAVVDTHTPFTGLGRIPCFSFFAIPLCFDLVGFQSSSLWQSYPAVLFLSASEGLAEDSFVPLASFPF